jgi:hypothetical protein
MMFHRYGDERYGCGLPVTGYPFSQKGKISDSMDVCDMGGLNIFEDFVLKRVTGNR